MGEAIAQAHRAEGHGDVPIGAVIARDGEVLAKAANERELRRDPTAHAEVLAIRAVAEVLGGWRLAGDDALYNPRALRDVRRRDRAGPDPHAWSSARRTRRPGRRAASSTFCTSRASTTGPR